MKFVVYQARNTITGDRYIGATTRGLERRKYEHLSDSELRRGYCQRFARAIRKYGSDAFEWTILAVVNDRTALAAEEIRLIAEGQPEYNITIGGRGIVGVPKTEAWCRMMSKKFKGRVVSEETRARIKARIRPEVHHKPVVCLNDGGVFASIKDAAKFYQLRQENVGAVVRGIQTFTGGLRKLSFVFSDAPLDEGRRFELLKQRTVASERERLRRASGLRSKPVVCVGDGARFPSALAAAGRYEISAGSVRASCNKGRTTVDGLSFRYEGAPIIVRQGPMAEQLRRRIDARDAGLRKAISARSKLVECLDTGEVFGSISAAARSFGMGVQALSEAIHRRGVARGYSFEFVE